MSKENNYPCSKITVVPDEESLSHEDLLFGTTMIFQHTPSNQQVKVANHKQDKSSQSED
jgi:hypothetical protein